MWKSTKEGCVVTFRKDNLTVVWDLGERKYKVLRTDVHTEHVELVEQGRAAHLPVESFLQYVDMTWGGDK